MNDFYFCALSCWLISLACSADTFHLVKSFGEDGLKRYPKPDFESESLIHRLFRVYMGVEAQGGSCYCDFVDLRVPPASVFLKCKLLEYLARSKLAANRFPQTIQVAFDALYSPDSISHSKSLGMQFVQWFLFFYFE